jgi:hypothetical protein
LRVTRYHRVRSLLLRILLLVGYAGGWCQTTFEKEEEGDEAYRGRLAAGTRPMQTAPS